MAFRLRSQLPASALRSRYQSWLCGSASVAESDHRRRISETLSHSGDCGHAIRSGTEARENLAPRERKVRLPWGFVAVRRTIVSVSLSGDNSQASRRILIVEPWASHHSLVEGGAHGRRFLSSKKPGHAKEFDVVEERKTLAEQEASDDEDLGEEVALFDESDREALEALGSGDISNVDLEQLENLLGSASPGDSTVGILYLKLGQEYDAAGVSAERILRCGENALKIFNSKQGEDVRSELGMSFHLIGTAYMRMEKYDKSLDYLNKSMEMLEKKGGKESEAAKCAVRFMIGEALSGMGKPEEALTHLRAAVSEQERLLGHGHSQLGRSYRQMAETLTHVMKHEEALPLVEKAIEIHTKASGEESMEIAIDRRLLAVIYIGLEEHEKALVQHKLVRKILAGTEHASQTVFVDIATADTEITLGKYDDAIASLETAISLVDHGSAMHALALVNLAKVYERQGKKAEADNYAQKVLDILENKVLANTDPLAVAEGFTELAALYGKLNQMESAIDLLRKAYAIYAPIPHQRNAAAGTQAQIGMLLFFTGKVQEAIPYLENAAETLQDAVGEQNFALAMVLNHLGVANVELERLVDATEHFERAKSIFDEVLGIDHDDTLAVARNLVNTYSLLDRLDDAIKYQKQIVQELRKKGDEVKEMLEEAVNYLMMLEDHSESGKPISQSYGSASPRQFGRIISD